SLCEPMGQQAGSTTPRDDLLSGLQAVLHTQPEGQLSSWAADRKDSAASGSHARAGPDATGAARADSGTGELHHSSAPRPLWVLRHCRQSPGIAAGPSSCGTLLAQDAEQPELARRGAMEGVSSRQGAVSAAATEAVPPVSGAARARGAVTSLF